MIKSEVSVEQVRPVGVAESDIPVGTWFMGWPNCESSAGERLYLKTDQGILIVEKAIHYQGDDDYHYTFYISRVIDITVKESTPDWMGHDEDGE